EVYEDRLRVGIDLADQASRKHHLLAEDPWPRVHDDEASAGLIRRFVNFADLAVASFDVESRQIDVRWCRACKGPGLDSRHTNLPSRLCLARFPYLGVNFHLPLGPPPKRPLKASKHAVLPQRARFLPLLHAAGARQCCLVLGRRLSQRRLSRRSVPPRCTPRR